MYHMQEFSHAALQSDRNQWEQIAEKYDKHTGDTGDEVHQLLYDPVIQELLGDVTGKTILDLGCGNGYWSRQLSPQANFIVGLDISPTLIRKAQERNTFENTTYMVADLEKPLAMFPSDTFDLAMSNLALHYLEDLSTVATELQRVIRQDGRVLIGIEHPAVNAHYRSLDSVGAKPRELERSVGYFERTHTRRTFMGESIYRFNRPLEDYISAFTKNGFTLTTFKELQTPTSFASHPTYTRLRDVPRFAVMEFTKR